MPDFGPDVYDDSDFFQQYIQKRARSTSPNDLLEEPIVEALMGSITGLDILDIGCGDGRFGEILIRREAKSYLGVDPSRKMIQRARTLHQQPHMDFQVEKAEEFSYPEEKFDLVLSRLALHYIADLQPVFEGIYRSLRPGGRFIASIEHPIITSCYDAYHRPGKRGDWIVDHYFEPGPRENQWMGKNVIKYHQPLQNYLTMLQAAGFQLQHLRESAPEPDTFDDPAEFQRRSRIPLFLIWEVKKP